jgi:microcystin degradation protein MlrC
VNVLFGFPFADVPDLGMTIQVLTNGDQKLARTVADDMARTAWRQREALLTSTKVYMIPEAVALAKAAVGRGDVPVVLADHSDRSGYATWLLKEIVQQDLSGVLIATITDRRVAERVKAKGAKPGDTFDMAVGGLADQSAGTPARVAGTILNVAEAYGQIWVAIKFGRDNVLIISSYQVQIMEPYSLAGLGLDIGSFQVFAIKSRVHFRGGFQDSGFAKTILLAEPTERFLGTVGLDHLKYHNIDLSQFYPYGEPEFPGP